MKPFTYQTYCPENPSGVQFRQGGIIHTTWLVGAETYSMPKELLGRLESMLNEPTAPTETRIDQVCTDFIVWFRAGYQQKHQKECPFEDTYILRKLGIIWVDASGKATVYRTKGIAICHIRNGLLEPFTEDAGTLQLENDSLLVIDPTGQNMAITIRDVLKNAIGQWEAVKQANFMQSVGVLKAKQVETEEPDLPLPSPPVSSPTPYILIASLVALIGLMLAGGYWYATRTPTPEPITKADSTQLVTLTDSAQVYLDDTEATDEPATDTIAITDNKPQPPADTTTTSDNEPVQPKTEDEKVVVAPELKPVVKPADRTVKPVADETTALEKAHIQFDTYRKTAQESLKLAEKHRAAKRTTAAVGQYKLALSTLDRCCQAQPARCGEVAKEKATIQTYIRQLTDESSF